MKSSIHVINHIHFKNKIYLIFAFIYFILSYPTLESNSSQIHLMEVSWVSIMIVTELTNIKTCFSLWEEKKWTLVTVFLAFSSAFLMNQLISKVHLGLLVFDVSAQFSCLSVQAANRAWQDCVAKETACLMTVREQTWIGEDSHSILQE